MAYQAEIKFLVALEPGRQVRVSAAVLSSEVSFLDLGMTFCPLHLPEGFVLCHSGLVICIKIVQTTRTLTNMDLLTLERASLHM